MSTEYGMYTFTKAKNAEVDYPALVDAMNDFAWTRGFGRWELASGDPTWSSEPWSYTPTGNPSKVVKWYRWIDDKCVRVEWDGTKCGDVTDTSKIYFDPDECHAIEDDEVAESMGIHVKKGWIEIACVTVESVKYISFSKLRIYASGRVRRLHSNSGWTSMGRYFAYIDDTNFRLAMGGE